MVRVFIAVDIEEPLLISRLSKLKRTIASTNAPLKLVEDENMHITLLFLGEVGESDVEALRAVMDETIIMPRFKIQLRGVGAFPTPSRPRVVWVGVGQGSEHLESLHRMVVTAARRAGLSFRLESFHPHITLARVKGSRNIASLTRVIGQLRDMEVGEALVGEVRLKQSTLTPRGPVYRTLHRVRLSGVG